MRAGMQKHGLKEYEFGIFELQDQKGGKKEKLEQEILEQQYLDTLFSLPSGSYYNISKKARVPIAEFLSERAKKALESNKGDKSILFGKYRGAHPSSKKLASYDKEGNILK